MIRKQLRPAILLTFVFIVVTGLVYPGIVTALAKVAFPNQASGSLVSADGHLVGSKLIGQRFTQPWYFHPRPSAAGDG
jgi:K+-transporting ATPase ATPase C chain